MTNVIAVVPTYHPDESLPGRVKRLGEQVGRVIIVDDGSGPGADRVLELALSPDVQVVRISSNRGIAHALNVGTLAAIEHGADFIVSVDQDSELPPEYVSQALLLFATSTPALNLGMAVVGSINGELQTPRWMSPEGIFLAYEAIQSGFVVSAECFASCGVFDDRLFIDCVDTEFCLRVRRSGFRIGLISAGDLQHSIGREAPLRPFGRQVFDDSGTALTYQYHSPFRRYYIARNNIDLILRYWNLDRQWCREVLRRERKGMYRSISSGPHRSQHLLAIAVGTVHGLSRRRGRIPRWLERAVSTA
jgi:rhamnosyltransferase